jgi:hypothetical protein
MNVNNPPAFPPNAGWRDDKPDYRGMTLRDYFAGQAITAIAGHSSPKAYSTEEVINAIAKGAYVIADAMLKVREQK